MPETFTTYTPAEVAAALRKKGWRATVTAPEVDDMTDGEVVVETGSTLVTYTVQVGLGYLILWKALDYEGTFVDFPSVTTPDEIDAQLSGPARERKPN